MPEMLEVEIYRRAAAASLGRTITALSTPDPWFLKGGVTGAQVADALVGRSFVADRRRGKLLMLDTSGAGPTLGLRFGMTGVLELDGLAAIDGLEYSSHRRDPAWERFVVHFDDGGALRLRDPRRLGGVELDPDEDRLGPDALDFSLVQLRTLLADSAAPLKARLMDQARIAGLGNLLTDELLWRAGLDPARAARSLDANEVARLRRSMRTTLRVLGARGGSHTGDLQDSRHRGGTCPRDGAALERRTIGGRTTYSCPEHQR
jgi:formamidopyrimidine-DNA glycosylase